MPAAISAASTWGIRRIINQFGGDTHVLAYYNPKYGLTTTGANINKILDVRGPNGYGPMLVSGTSGGTSPQFIAFPPQISCQGSKILTTVGSSSLFDLSTPKAIIAIMSTTSNGFHNLIAICDSAGAVRFLAVAINTDWCARAGGFGSIATITGVQVPSSTTRVIIASSGAGNVNLDVPVAGSRIVSSYTAASTGSNFLCFGGYFDGSESQACQVQDVIVLDHVPTFAEVSASVQFGVGARGAVTY